MYKVLFTKQAQKDAIKASQTGLKKKIESLIEILKQNPFQAPPPYEKLLGDLTGAYSRRINIQHRLVYQVYEGRATRMSPPAPRQGCRDKAQEKTVKVIRMWTHYE
jgi:Txe/YoeB family toxin of toxin-antitoxin system